MLCYCRLALGFEGGGVGEYTLRAGDGVEATRIELDGHSHGAGKSLEAGFDDMVAVKTGAL